MDSSRVGIKVGIVVGILLVLLIGSFQMFENVDQNDILCVQAPFSGKLSWYVSGGIQWQVFGKVTIYPKRSIYTFETSVRFNEGGHGTMHGSV
jgi:hypothetical protein